MAPVDGQNEGGVHVVGGCKTRPHTEIDPSNRGSYPAETEQQIPLRQGVARRSIFNMRYRPNRAKGKTKPSQETISKVPFPLRGRVKVGVKRDRAVSPLGAPAECVIGFEVVSKWQGAIEPATVFEPLCPASSILGDLASPRFAGSPLGAFPHPNRYSTKVVA